MSDIPAFVFCRCCGDPGCRNVWPVMSDIPAFVFCRCCGDPGCRNVWADWPPTARTKPSASNEQDRRLPTGCDCGNCDDEETPEWTV